MVLERDRLKINHAGGLYFNTDSMILQYTLEEKFKSNRSASSVQQKKIVLAQNFFC